MTDLTEAEQLENVETVESIFNDEPEAETEAAPAPVETQEEAPAEEVEAESEAKGEEAAPPAAEDGEAEQESVPMKVALDERRKRQELEKEVKRLKETYEKEENNNFPDPVTDPEGYKNAVKAQIQAEELETRIVSSQEEMRLKHADYDEKEVIFARMAALDPSLIDEMKSSPKPALFAYEKASELVGQLKPVAAKPKTQEEKRKESAVKVPDLTKVTAKASNTTPVEKKQEFDQLFADQSY